jgi:hypothetical protein
MTVVRPSLPLLHQTHRDLLRGLGQHVPARARVDGVVVPSIRPPVFLDYARLLASTWDCPLLILRSGATEWPLVAAHRRLDRLVTIGVPPGFRLPVAEFQTSRRSDAVTPRDIDVSTKRNIGLLVARLLGWRRLLFLDDDTRGLDPRDVLRVMAHVGCARAVGWRIKSHPDNSVVGHANRISGAAQDVFIGAGGLAVDTQGCLPFFPAVYNEDWLFLFAWLQRSAVLAAGEIQQARYDPFADPQRAAREEFGDVLGEGLFHLLHSGESVRRARSVAYWAEVLDTRWAMINNIESRLERKPFRGEEVPSRSSILRSLAVARCRSEGIRPESLAEYVDAWRGDLHAWNGQLARLPRLGSLPEALDFLGLSEHVIDARTARTA